ENEGGARSLQRRVLVAERPAIEQRWVHATPTDHVDGGALAQGGDHRRVEVRRPRDQGLHGRDHRYSRRSSERGTHAISDRRGAAVAAPLAGCSPATGVSYSSVLTR